MLAVGPVSSLFDFLTFYVMLRVFHAGRSPVSHRLVRRVVATQVLVIFVIRTHLNPLSSRPHPWLMATSLGVVATAVALPFTMAGAALGLVPLPLGFFGVLAALVVVYLLAVEAVKRVFYRRFAV